MHARGWISIYCMPPRPAFKGSAPLNLSDRLNQVLRWALGSIEIMLSRHCPIWYGYKGRLRFLERLAYINTVVYPLTSIPLIAYCILPAICLLTNKFIIPTVRLPFSFFIMNARLDVSKMAANLQTTNPSIHHIVFVKGKISHIDHLFFGKGLHPCRAAPFISKPQSER